MKIVGMFFTAVIMLFVTSAVGEARSYYRSGGSVHKHSKFRSDYKPRGIYLKKGHAHRSGRRASRFAGRYRGLTPSRGRATTSISCLTQSTRNAWDRIAYVFPGVRLVSTCRPGARIATSGNPSLHGFGKAIDFNAPPGKKALVIAWLKQNFNGGIMTYYDMGHIHIDTGPHFVALNAWSGHTKRRRRI